MKRRAFITALGIALASPRLARAQRSGLPVVGFFRSTSAAPFTHLVAAFLDGLKGAGFVVGRNVRIEYRYADNRKERLPAIAAELVQAGVAVIIGNSLAAEAAKQATAAIPIVFVTADDPVKRGLVASLARPGGNATGFTFFGGGKLAAKRFEILCDLVPTSETVGLLLDSRWPGSGADLADVEAAARVLHRRVVIRWVGAEADLAPAVTALLQSGAGALVVGGSPFYASHRASLIELSARHSLPTIYDLRDYVGEGGLISYSGSFTEAYRQAGIYVGKILRGTKPNDLPVQQPTKFELAINLKTAKTLGLAVPRSILARADEIIE